MVRELDGTRPIYHSGYGPVEGSEDAISVHYPEGERLYTWPNVLFWPTDPSQAGNDSVAGHFKAWDGRTPLMVGEHMLEMDRKAPLIVISPGTPAARQRSLARVLKRFVSRGGVVLVLAQASWSEGWLPVDASLMSVPSNMVYPESGGHPVTSDLPATSLRFWRPNHHVMRHSLGGLRSGATRVLAHYPVNAVVEAPVDGGTYLLCQIDLHEVLDEEPMALRLLARMIGYLDTFEAEPPAPAALLAERDSLYADAFERLGARFDARWSSWPGDGPPTSVRQVIVDGSALSADAQTWRALARWVDGGGRLVVHGLSAAQVQAIAEAFDLDMKVTDVEASTLRLHRHRLNRGMSDASIAFGSRLWADAPFPAIEAEDARFGPATTPMLWGEAEHGEGRLVIDQTGWPREPEAISEADRFGLTLMSNVGVPIARLPVATGTAEAWRRVDLRAAVNEGARARGHHDQPVDPPPRGPLLRGDGPVGDQVFHGVAVHLLDPRIQGERGVLIRLNNQVQRNDQLLETFPGGPGSVRVDLAHQPNVSALAFVHSHRQVWDRPHRAYDHPVVWAYVIEYRSGRTTRLPVMHGEHVGDLGGHSGTGDLTQARLAFQARDESGQESSYYLMRWRNPTPEDKIVGMRVEAMPNTHRQPLILATPGPGPDSLLMGNMPCTAASRPAPR